MNVYNHEANLLLRTTFRAFDGKQVRFWATKRSFEVEFLEQGAKRQHEINQAPMQTRTKDPHRNLICKLDKQAARFDRDTVYHIKTQVLQIQLATPNHI